MAEYHRDEHEGGGGFMMGLLTGTVLGAGLGMLLAPKSGSELRNQLTEGASSLGRRASGTVSDMTDRARDTAHRGAEQLRGRASGSGFASGVGLGATDTMSRGSGGAITPGSEYSGGTSTGSSTGSTGATGGSTYTGFTTDSDPDRL